MIILLRTLNGVQILFSVKQLFVATPTPGTSYSNSSNRHYSYSDPSDGWCDWTRGLRPVSISCHLHKKKWIWKTAHFINEDKAGPSKTEGKERTRGNLSIPIHDWAAGYAKRFQPYPGEQHYHLAIHNGATTLELDHSKAKQLQSLSREGGIDKVYGVCILGWFTSLKHGIKKKQIKLQLLSYILELHFPVSFVIT